MQEGRAIWRFISGNPVLSAASNVLTFAPLVVGAIALIVGWMRDLSGLLLIGIGLLVVNLAWLAYNGWKRREAAKSMPLGVKERRERIDDLFYPPRSDRFELGEACATFAMKMGVFNEEQEWKREKLIAHVAQELRGIAPDIDPEQARKEAEVHFQRNVEAAYALEMRDEALELFDQAREEGAIAAKARRTVERPLAVEMREVPNLFLALARRLGYERTTNSPPAFTRSSDVLCDQLDSLMREGMKLVDEFNDPVKPQKTNGGWQLEGGDAPEQWWEKADEFTKRARELLADQHPALLTDYRDGYNAHLKKEREETKERQAAEDTGSTAEKMLAFANYERSGPRRVMEASLEGLAKARKTI